MRWIFVCFFIWLMMISTAVNAQVDDFALPDTEPIELENVGYLVELAVVGDGSINQISLSPNGDQLAVVNRQGIYVYSLNDSDIKPQTIGSEYAPIINSLFSPDWSWVALSTPSRLIIIDVRTGEKIRDLFQAKGYSAYGSAHEMALSPNGHWLAATMGMDGGQAMVWDMETGEELYSHYHRYSIGSPIWGPNNDVFAYGYYELCFQCGDTPTFWQFIDTNMWHPYYQRTNFGAFSASFITSALNPNTPFNTSIPFVDYSAESGIVVSQGHHGQTIIWDVSRGIRLFTLLSHYQFKSFTPQGNLLVIDTLQRELLSIDPFTQHEQFMAYGDAYSQVAFSTESNQFAIADSTGTIRIIDLGSITETNRITTNYLGEINEVVVDAHNETVYFTDGWSNLRSLNLETGEINLIVHDPTINGLIAYDPYDDIVALGTTGGSIQIWDPIQARLITTLQEHEGAITDIAFSPDGTVLASSSVDRTIRLWDDQTGIGTVLAEYSEGDIERIAFNADGTQLLASDRDGRLETVLYELATSTQIDSMSSFNRYRLGIVFSDDGKLLALNDSLISIGEGLSLEISPELRLETNPIAIVFNPQSDLLFTSSSHYTGMDNEISAWNITNGKQEIVLDNFITSITSMAFSSDGRLLIGGEADGKIHIVGVPSNGG